MKRSSKKYEPVLNVLCSYLSSISTRISTISEPNIQRISATYPRVFPVMNRDLERLEPVSVKNMNRL